MRTGALLRILPLLAWAASSAPAAVLTVDTLADGTTGPACELSEAITAANDDFAVGGCEAGDGVDAIVFDVTGTIELQDSLPALQGVLLIHGPGADLLTVSGGDAVPVMAVAPGAEVEIEGITIADGAAVGTGRGGGIQVLGALAQLQDCRVTSSSALNGGGIDVNGSVVGIERCLIDGNATTGGSGAGVINSSGTLEIVNSTIVGNTATQSGAGGGVATVGTGTPAVTRIASSTLAGNAASAGGNLFNGALESTTVVTHTILADATAGASCSGTIESNGFNLATDASCALAGTGDQQSTPAGLAALADNGGRTPTRALLTGSVAIDAGDFLCRDNDGGVLTRDQRGLGFPRVTDGNLDGIFRCDVGAVEAVPEPGAGALAAAAALARLARRHRLRVP